MNSHIPINKSRLFISLRVPGVSFHFEEFDINIMQTAQYVIFVFAVGIKYALYMEQ